MEIVVGCDLEEFRRYYRDTLGDLGDTEEDIILEDPEHLIVWREGCEILGHAIWHPSNTRRHPDGSQREETDRRLLEGLIDGPGDFAELHELWLRKEHRGKGYGEMFFDFFEGFIGGRGYDTIVYYTDNLSALAICRQRGYREAYGVELDGIDPQGEAYYILALDLRCKVNLEASDRKP